MSRQRRAARVRSRVFEFDGVRWLYGPTTTFRVWREEPPARTSFAGPRRYPVASVVGDPDAALRQYRLLKLRRGQKKYLTLGSRVVTSESA